MKNPFIKLLQKSGAALNEEQIDAVAEFDEALEELSKAADGTGADEELGKAKRVKKDPESKESLAAKKAAKKEAGGEANDDLEEDETGEKKKPKNPKDKSYRKSRAEDGGDGEEEEEDESEEEESAESEEPEETEEEAEEESEEEAEETPVEKSRAAKKAKTLAAEVSGRDPEAAAAMDVEPFLKALTASIDERLQSLNKSVSARLFQIEKSVTSIINLQKSQAGAIVAEGNLLKSLTGTDDDSRNEPLERQSVLTNERFQKSVKGAEDITLIEARSKLVELAKSKALNPMQVSIVEGRLNKGLPLPDYFLKLILNKEGE